MNVTETQPVITSATIVSLGAALLGLLIAFGLPISNEQKVAILTLIGIVAPFVAAWWPQRKTTPLANPTITAEDGTPVSLIRADTGRATNEAIKAGNVV